MPLYTCPIINILEVVTEASRSVSADLIGGVIGAVTSISPDCGCNSVVDSVHIVSSLLSHYRAITQDSWPCPVSLLLQACMSI